MHRNLEVEIILHHGVQWKMCSKKIIGGTALKIEMNGNLANNKPKTSIALTSNASLLFSGLEIPILS